MQQTRADNAAGAQSVEPAAIASSVTKAGEIRALTGARAIPPLLLVLYHYHEGHGYQDFRPFDVFAAKGYLWVEFFFALSGFVLVHAYGPRARELWTASGYGGFLKNRLARLYPLQLATLLIMLAMMVGLRALAHAGGYVSVFDLAEYHPHTDIGSFFANLFLVQAWHVVPYLSWNGVAWFVSVEFFLCLIFPLYLLLSGGGTGRALVLILIGFAALYGLARHSGHGLDITYDWGVLRGMADFAVGVGMAMLWRQARERADALPDIAFTLMQLLVFALFLYAMYDTGWSHHAADFWVVPPMVLLILTIAFDRGLLAHVFATTPLKRLGEWSYAIYMGQTTWLMLLRFAEQRLYPGMAGARWVHIAEPVGLVIVCTAWGWLLYRLIEQPANRAIRALFRPGGRHGVTGARTPS